MTVFEKAQKYYPDRWNKHRLRQLVEAGKLTAAEYEEIVGEAYEQE